MEERDAILVVDDEASVVSALLRELSDEEYQVTGATGGAMALKLLEQHTYQVVISDERMPGMDGAEFLTQVRLHHPETVRMMLTGHARLESTVRAVNQGEIFRFFTKPWDVEELKLALRAALEKYHLENENRRLLRTVRCQSQELKRLERTYPGISELRKDAQGAIAIDTLVTDEELAQIIAECNLSNE